MAQDQRLDDVLTLVKELERIGEIRDKGIKREFQNVYEHVDNRFKRLEDSVDARFRDVDARFDAVDARFDAMDARLDKMDARFDAIDSRLESLEARFSNFKIVHLRQRVYPVPGYNTSGKRLQIPACFPFTALRLYRLQDRKNWRKLKALLEYYRLERETIRSVHPVDLSASDTDTDTDSDSEDHYNENDLQRAIMSNAFGAMRTLGSHLGIDCDALHDRVTQLEFQQAKEKAAKRRAEDSGSENRRIRRAFTENPAALLESRHSEEKLSEEAHTELHWEHNSESSGSRPPISS